MSNYEILRENVRRNGEAAQIDKAIEEMAELTQALLKWRHADTNENFDHVCEETADVKIVLAELQMILNAADSSAAEHVAEWERRKIKRIFATL